MSGDNETVYPSAWVRAVLDVAVLGCLDEAPRHGYGIAQHLEDRGLGRLKGGSLYPALARLEDAGDVTAAWIDGAGGPGRRQYAITSRGRRRLRDELAAWRRLVASLDPAGDTPRATHPSTLARPSDAPDTRSSARGEAS